MTRSTAGRLCFTYDGEIYTMDPASGIAGVIMMQLLPFADERALNVYRQSRKASIDPSKRTKPVIAANGERRPARVQFTCTPRARPV